MINDISKLFEEAITYWPQEVQTKNKTLHDNGGATIPELMKVHDKIEDKISELKDNNLLLHMDWAIFTVLHQLAKSQNSVRPHDLRVSNIKEIYQRNLKLSKQNPHEPKNVR